ncbi:MAG: hypothetical protein CVU69_07010 [Deltaproteobacteria bacterium HGW-Deltaproteobacteria-4]|nr:MAG: hypothetical protein CVU69_07010 [Deltaproteobacteria bacterium HGW-Deltaproteobacteria-4]
MAMGVGVYLAMDFVSTLIWGAPPPKTAWPSTASQPHLIYSLVWELLGHWILPFVLWIVPAHREILAMLPESGFRSPG